MANKKPVGLERIDISLSKRKAAGLEWLDRNLLISQYCYALCLSEESFHAELKRLGVPERTWPEFLKTTHAHATTHFFENLDDSANCAIVTMHPVTDKEIEQVYALLVHEAVHIWQYSKEVIGEDHPGKETEAYAIQHIAQSLMFSYKEQTAPKRKKK